MRLVGGSRLQLVQVVVKGWNALLHTLALACVSDNNSWFGFRRHGVARQDLPVVKHTLWEGLAASVGSQVSSETCTSTPDFSRNTRRDKSNSEWNLYKQKQVSAGIEDRKTAFTAMINLASFMFSDLFTSTDRENCTPTALQFHEIPAT